MLLSELAAASGTTVASIKYYRREGLLPPGERVTATRQEYGQAHLERLQLIQVLREVADAPIARIARLAAILDDPEQPVIHALAAAQIIALGLEGLEDPEDPESPAEQAEQAGAGDDRGEEPGERPGEHPSIAPLLEHLGWPDVDSAPRRALDHLLRSLDSWGAPTHTSMLQRYAEPMAEIARADVAWMRGLPTSDGEGSPALSDDVLVMRAVAGTIAYNRLVQLLRALGHTSLSVLDTRPSPDP